jgi:hypothetical protein
MKQTRVLLALLTVLFWVTLAWAEQTSNVMTVSAGDGKVNTTDPDCTSVGTWCGWINVVLPPGSQFDSASVAGSTDGQNFVNCPAVLNGPKYQYMDCTDIKIRFLNTKPDVVNTSSGVQVNWKMVNWNSHKAWGKLVVNYHQ